MTVRLGAKSSVAMLLFGLGNLATADPVANPRATITPAPEIPLELAKRVTFDPSFLAWEQVGNSYSAIYCDQGDTFYNSASFAGCCGAAACYPRTACNAGTITDNNGGTSLCGAGSACQTFSIFSTSGDANYLTRIFCGISNITGYRNSPVSAAASSTTSTPSTTTTPTTPTPTKKPNPTNVGAIVGGVVGGVAFIGIVALIALVLCLRHRKQKNKAVAGTPAQGAPVAPMAAAASPMAPQENYGGVYSPQPQKEDMSRYSVAPSTGWGSPAPEYGQYQMPQQPPQQYQHPSPYQTELPAHPDSGSPIQHYPGAAQPTELPANHPTQ